MLLADTPSVITSHPNSAFGSAPMHCNHAAAVLFWREQGPGGPRRFIGERDNRPIEASPRREPLQPLGTAIIMFRQSKHHCAGAVDHLPPEIMIGAPANATEPGVSRRSCVGVARARSHAASSPPERKWRPSSTAATSAVATTGPTPGSLEAGGTLCPANSCDPLVELRNPEIEGVELFEHVAEEPTCEIGQFGGRDGIACLL